MTRVRARRVRDRRDTWALSPEADLARGVDLAAFSSPLAAIYARQAARFAGRGDQAAAIGRLRHARTTETAFRALPSGELDR